MRIYGFESYGGPEVEGFLEVPEPAPRPGTVLVETIAAGVNPADIKVRSGQRQGGFPVEFPMAMGREAVGVVRDSWHTAETAAIVAERTAPGAPVPPLVSSGSLVFGSCAPGVGALGERTLLDASSVATVVSGLPFLAAACLPVAVGTAYDAVAELGVRRGEVVLVLGAGGGVGIHAVQLAARDGATVLGVASAGKAGVVAEYGGIAVESGTGWSARVAGELRRRGLPPRVHAIIDCVGGEVLREAAGLLPGGPGPRRLRSLADTAGAAELGGSGVHRRRTSEVFAEVANLVRGDDLVVALSAVIPFERAGEAFRAVESGHVEGKVVVDMTPHYEEGLAGGLAAPAAGG